MQVFANFVEMNGSLFRLDTRIYLKHYDPDLPSLCVGAIIGKNPGSAKPKVLGEFAPLDIGRDNMLPSVANRFNTAYELSGKQAPANAFVRVWNLMYICNEDLKQAITVYKHIPDPPICISESNTAPVVWFGWGGSEPVLNRYKNRFLGRSYTHPFFYIKETKQVSATLPLVTDAAGHTQGSLTQPIVQHLATVLRINK